MLHKLNYSLLALVASRLQPEDLANFFRTCRACHCVSLDAWAVSVWLVTYFDYASPQATLLSQSCEHETEGSADDLETRVRTLGRNPAPTSPVELLLNFSNIDSWSESKVVGILTLLLKQVSGRVDRRGRVLSWAAGKGYTQVAELLLQRLQQSSTAKCSLPSITVRASNASRMNCVGAVQVRNRSGIIGTSASLVLVAHRSSRIVASSSTTSAATSPRELAESDPAVEDAGLWRVVIPAAVHSDSVQMLQLLRQFGFGPHFQRQWTIWCHMALMHRCTASLQWLIRFRPADLRGRTGTNFLTLAINYAATDMAQQACMDSPTEDPNSQEQPAAPQQQAPDQVQPDQDQDQSDPLAAVKVLLSAGACPNSHTGHGAPVTAAALHGLPDAMQLLLQHGADVEANDGEALLVAVQRRHAHMASMLLEHGADPCARHGEIMEVAASHDDKRMLALLQAWKHSPGHV